MMTTDNIYKNEVPEIAVEPSKPKRHRRTKAQMAAARRKTPKKSAYSESRLPDAKQDKWNQAFPPKNGSEIPHVSPFPLPVAAQPAAKWLCENLMAGTEGHNIGLALAKAILESEQS